MSVRERKGSKVIPISTPETKSGSREFYIEYNPYINETKFLVDGKEASGLFESFRKGYRLQQYLEKRGNWPGLLEAIINKCNSNSIDLTFKGRQIDFEDLELCINASEHKDVFDLEFIPAKNDNDMMSDIGELLKTLNDTDIDELKDNKNVLKAYQDALKAQLKVSVIATMSSGKSTLINSLLGRELLPSQNEACTATVARILDNDDGMDYFSCICKNKDEEEILRADKVDREQLEEYNTMGKDMPNDDPKKIIFMDMEGPIPGIDSGKVRLLLQDTPGPNNSRDEKHKQLTEDMIKDKKNSVIIYVMNATQLSVQDDFTLLTMVSKAMKDGGKQARDRFIFVVNKFDALDLEKENPENTINATREYLARFGIEQPNIFPVSAYAALLIRKSQLGEYLSRKERQDLGGYIFNFGDPEFTESHFEKLADLSPSVRKIIEKRLENADELERALIHTGIPAIEETINEYLEKYAYPIKVNDAVNELQSIVRELDMVRKFNDDLANDTSKREKLAKQIEEAQKKQAQASGYKEDFKKRIDSFKMDTSAKTELSRKVNKQIEEIRNDYCLGDEVSENDAKKILKNFETSVKKLKERFETELKSIIEGDLKTHGNQMAAEYSDVVRKLFKDIPIDGMDFSDVQEIKGKMISDMDDLISKNSRKEDITEEYTVSNPERSGFFGFFKVWKPKYITKTRVVGQNTYVDVHGALVNEVGNIETIFIDNISQAFLIAENEVSHYKIVFKKNLDELDKKINELLAELKHKAENVEELKKNIAENSTKLKQIEALTTKIGNIMNF